MTRAAGGGGGGVTARPTAPDGLTEPIRTQHTHVTAGPDLNYNVSVI